MADEENDLNDLKKSFWITANAGSGKTTHLVNRFLSLLKSGLKPEEIFCITYTRAGASEMAERVLRLSKENGLFLKRYQLKISTIHSMCKDLLEQNGEISKDIKIFNGDEKIKRKIIEKIIKSLEFCENVELKKSITNILSNLSEVENITSFYELVDKIIKQQNAFLSLFAKIVKPNSNGFSSNRILESIDIKRMQELLPNGLTKFVDYQPVLFEKRKKLQDELKQCDLPFLCSLAIEVLGEKEFEKKYSNHYDFHKLENWRSIVLTTTNTRRKKVDKSSSKIVVEIQDYFVEQLRQIGINSTISTLQFAYFVLFEYQKIKTEMEVITYDDILFQALQSIKSGSLVVKNGEIVGSKIKFLMLDEAQDTNPISWEIVEEIVRRSGCNFFVVGDKKQSIYRFQGARVEEYERNKEVFRKIACDFGHIFVDDANLLVSYRSISPILEIADKFCNNEKAKRNFTTKGEEKINHIFNENIVKDKADGYNLPYDKSIIFKDIEEFYGNEDEEENQEDRDENTELAGSNEQSLWLARINKEREKQENRKKSNENVAGEIAEYVRINQEEIDAGIVDKKYNRVALIYPKNSNGDIFEIVNALRKNHNIEVELKPEFESRSIYFYDLLAFFQFACLQIDNMNLACLLKSDFFGFDDKLLQNICTSGKRIDIENTLWQKIQSQVLLDAEENQKVKYAVETLKKVVACISTEEVFSVIKLIIESNGELLGNYVNAFDLLKYCIEKYKDSYNFDIRGFIEAVGSDNFEDYEKNDTLQTNDEHKTKSKVFLSTIHGVKGMEFDSVIFLKPKNKASNGEQFLFFGNSFWYKASGAKLQEDDDNCAELLEAIDEDKELTESEKYRLFYVAITRARRRLVYIGDTCDVGRKGQEDYFYRQLFLNSKPAESEL